MSAAEQYLSEWREVARSARRDNPRQKRTTARLLEAKDTDDNLDEEIKKKKAKGYPLTNIIFEDTRTAVLYQSKEEVLRVDLTDSAQLVRLLQQFFSYIEPDVEGFEQAVDEFKDRVPELFGISFIR
ncbi:MAG: hypothetical protein WAN65_29660 [Candidatus Sulfotelmatobacter sp.]